MSKSTENTCTSIYNKIFNDTYKIKNRSKVNMDDIDSRKLKDIIEESFVNSLSINSTYPPDVLWSNLYSVFMKRLTGISDEDTINKVIRAHQTWNTTSGHAFEEFVKHQGNIALQDTDIEILLQRDVSAYLKNMKKNKKIDIKNQAIKEKNIQIKNKNREIAEYNKTHPSKPKNEKSPKTLIPYKPEIANSANDLSSLTKWLKSNSFDLYICKKEDHKRKIFGCIQAKTSIRERIGNDRTPSLQAMDKQYWSSIIILNGKFIDNQKFTDMVNGHSSEFNSNSWHGAYVLSNITPNERIYKTDFNFAIFVKHAIQAADIWDSSERAYLKKEWIPSEN